MKSQTAKELIDFILPKVRLWSEKCAKIDVYTVYTPVDVYDLLYGTGNTNHDEFGVYILGTQCLGGECICDNCKGRELAQLHPWRPMNFGFGEYLEDKEGEDAEKTYENVMRICGADVEYDLAADPEDSEKMLEGLKFWDQNFVKVLASIPFYRDQDAIKLHISSKIDHFLTWAEEDESDFTAEDAEALDFTEDEIDVFIQLHNLVIAGELRLTTMF